MKAESRSRMVDLTLWLIEEYKKKTPYEILIEEIRKKLPDEEINMAWVKNRMRQLRMRGLIATEDRGIGWAGVIREIAERRNPPGSGSISAPADEKVPLDLLLPEARNYSAKNSSVTKGVAEGFQRFSAIARLQYVGQLDAYAKKLGVNTKVLLDEALRTWIKIKAIATSHNQTVDEVIADLQIGTKREPKNSKK